MNKKQSTRRYDNLVHRVMTEYWKHSENAGALKIKPITTYSFMFKHSPKPKKCYEK